MKIKHPSSIIVYGASDTGKTELVIRMIEERQRLFTKKIEEILFFYTIWNERYASVKDVIFIEGPLTDIPRDNKPRLVICDDMMTSKASYPKLVSLFVRESHHNNITVILPLNDMFFDKIFRTISLNTKLFFLLGHRRDVVSTRTLFHQMPDSSAFLTAIYKRATERKYDYLCCNLETETELLRFCTNVFDPHVKFFVAKGTYRGKPLPVTFK